MTSVTPSLRREKTPFPGRQHLCPSDEVIRRQLQPQHEGEASRKRRRRAAGIVTTRGLADSAADRMRDTRQSGRTARAAAMLRTVAAALDTEQWQEAEPRHQRATDRSDRIGEIEDAGAAPDRIVPRAARPRCQAERQSPSSAPAAPTSNRMGLALNHNSPRRRAQRASALSTVSSSAGGRMNRPPALPWPIREGPTRRTRPCATISHSAGRVLRAQHRAGCVRSNGVATDAGSTVTLWSRALRSASRARCGGCGPDPGRSRAARRRMGGREGPAHARRRPLWARGRRRPRRNLSSPAWFSGP